MAALLWPVTVYAHSDVYLPVQQICINWCSWKSVRSTEVSLMTDLLLWCCTMLMTWRSQSGIFCLFYSFHKNINLLIIIDQKVNSVHLNVKNSCSENPAQNNNDPLSSQDCIYFIWVGPLLIHSTCMWLGAFVVACIGIHITRLGVQKAEQALREKHCVDESKSILKLPPIISNQTGNPEWFSRVNDLS